MIERRALTPIGPYKCSKWNMIRCQNFELFV